jgi:uncharacterized membrane-anchored protein
MKSTVLNWTAACLLAAGQLVSAQEPTTQTAAAFVDSLKFQSGDVVLEEPDATLHVAGNWQYLAQADARRVLEDFWGNPPDTGVLGLLVPKSPRLDEEHAWVVVVSYSDDGYVSDEDAAKIDYTDLLAQMQQETQDANEALKNEGYPTARLVGWAERPRYDATARKFHWAKEIDFDSSDSNTLNYEVRVLGRRGYLNLTAVAGMADLATVNSGMQEALALSEFNPGARYADYNAGTDKLAGYGLAALVGGAAAGKLGLFAKLGILLAKGWKIVLLAVVGLGSLARRLLNRGDKTTPG